MSSHTQQNLRNGTSSNNSEASQWADKEVFTTGEAAQVCNVSQQTIIRCFDSGRLQGFRVPGSKFRRIPREDLLRFMRENDIPTETLAPTNHNDSTLAVPPSGKKRVLIVDDDPQIIDVFVEFLSRNGDFDVRTAQTGYDAGMQTEAFRPDLILLDYMLPDVNGNVVCRELRKRPELAGTKIVFISGVVGRDSVDKLKEAGANAFIAKPFDLAEVLHTIQSLLGVTTT